MTSAIGIAILAVFGMWLTGGLVLRLGGALVALAGIIGLALGAGASGIFAAAFGALIWLMGQGHYALRHGAPKSRLVCRLARSNRLWI